MEERNPMPECPIPGQCPWTPEMWQKFGRYMENVDAMHADVGDMRATMKAMEEKMTQTPQAPLTGGKSAMAGGTTGFLGGIIVVTYSYLRSRVH